MSQEEKNLKELVQMEQQMKEIVNKLEQEVFELKKQTMKKELLLEELKKIEEERGNV